MHENELQRRLLDFLSQTHSVVVAVLLLPLVAGFSSWLSPELVRRRVADSSKERRLGFLRQVVSHSPKVTVLR